jgi:H+/Cl- antiporter ClcA
MLILSPRNIASIRSRKPLSLARLSSLTRPSSLAAMAYIIDRVASGGGSLEVRNAAVFVLGSMIGIGVGAPVGADTPSALIGGHLGSWLAQRLHWRDDFTRSLVVAGVGAGLAATYFAQLSAVFFALEVVLGGFGGAIFIIPTLFAVLASTLFTSWVSGFPPHYPSPEGAGTWGLSLLVYAGVAIVAALASIAYVNLLPRMRARWVRVAVPFWAKTALPACWWEWLASFCRISSGLGLTR